MIKFFLTFLFILGDLCLVVESIKSEIHIKWITVQYRVENVPPIAAHPVHSQKF
jgi:hypothetical protein